MASTGVAVDDFNQIAADFNRTVSYQVVTRTQDPITGDETTTFANASNKSVIFFLTQNKYVFDKSGLLQVGDAYIIAPTTMGIARYDRFTVDGQTYFIENTTRRTVAGVAMMDYATCFKVA